ncbi:MAG TPA: response regulator [Polyangiaceae bacterium]|jgi:two-component system chemotaxis response regulator CheY|nr:response regulator [Polyangiaceae bacterium]
MNILVIDDSKAMRLIVRRTLRQAGIPDDAIQEATNGAEALKSLRQGTFDLVLSDWNMPEMSGIDLCTTLTSEGPKVPFVFVTSEGSQEMRDRARSAGAVTLITKPFNAESIRSVIDPILGR